MASSIPIENNLHTFWLLVFLEKTNLYTIILLQLPIHIVTSNYFHLITICLHPVLKFQVFQFNTHNFQTALFEP